MSVFLVSACMNGGRNCGRDRGREVVVVTCR